MVQPTKTVQARGNVAQTRQSAGAQRFGARAVGTYVPRITKAAFEKFGFSTAQLLTDWPQIAGPALAAHTTPDRIVWPRRSSAEADEGVRRGPQTGATLHLMVDPARALEVQYGLALLIDRINAYFGYRAVSEIRIYQASRPPTHRPAAVTPPGPARASAPLEGFADSGLQAALERMRAGLGTRR